MNKLPSKGDRRLTTVAEIKQRKYAESSRRGTLQDNLKLPQDKEGFIMKNSPSIWAGWQRRYLILKDRKLKYFKSNSKEDLKVPLGVINFDHFRCWCEPIDDGKKPQFLLQIEGIDAR